MHSQPVSVQHQQQDHTGTLHCVLDTLGGSRLGRFLSSPSVRTAHAIWVATLPQRPPRPSLIQPGAPSFTTLAPTSFSRNFRRHTHCDRAARV